MLSNFPRTFLKRGIVGPPEGPPDALMSARYVWSISKGDVVLGISLTLVSLTDTTLLYASCDVLAGATVPVRSEKLPLMKVRFPLRSFSFELRVFNPVKNCDPLLVTLPLSRSSTKMETAQPMLEMEGPKEVTLVKPGWMSWYRRWRRPW